MSEILISNPTPYPRTQIAVFGVPEGATDQGEVLVKRDNFEIRCANIRVEANASGYQELESLPYKEPDFMEPSFISKDGEEYELEEVLAETNMMRVSMWMAKCEKTVDRIITYQGRGEPWVRYQYVGALESLYAAEMEVDLGFDASFDGDTALVMDRVRGNSGMNLYKGVLRDGGAIQSWGTIFDVDSIDMDSRDGMDTYMAEYTWDLDVAGDYRLKWGPWDTVPSGFHLDRNLNPSPLAHRGVILNKRPGDVADQAGFGRWKNLDTISQGIGKNLAHDKAATNQEVCRNIWLFNADGSFPVKGDHPNFSSWSEWFHFDPSISPDRFRRLYTHYGWYDGWLRMDEEHYSCTALKESFMLRGDFLSLVTLRMKAFHLWNQGRWNAAGRSLGRCGMGALDCYIATEDSDLLEDIKNRLIPAIKANFITVNGEPTVGDTRASCALRLYKDDPHTNIKGLEWIVWEDAQAVGAMDRLWQLTNDPELKVMTYWLGRSIVWHGVDEDMRILKAIKYNGPGKPFGPEKADSKGTDYHSWAYDTWAITARLALEWGDEDTAKRAAAMGEAVRKGTYSNRHSYLAPAT